MPSSTGASQSGGRRLFLIVAVASVIAGALGYGIGVASLSALYAEQQQQASLVEQLQRREAMHESNERLAQQVNEQNRKTIKLLEEQIFRQQQDLTYYKGVLDPGAVREGLVIRAFEILPVGEETPRRFRYKVMLSRVGSDEHALQGTLQMNVEGLQDGKRRTLGLEALGQGLHAFGFKHFQAIPDVAGFAEIELPEGFQPVRVELVATVEGQDKPVRQQYKWP